MDNNNNNNNRGLYQNEKTGSMPIGAGQIILGIIIILLAAFTSWLSIVVIGIGLSIWGLIELKHSLNKKVNWWRLPLSLFAFTTGLIFLINPGIGSSVLSILLAILFALGGISNLITAGVKKTSNRGWVAVSGLLSLIMSIAIVIMWPINNFMALGVLVGIEIMINGGALAVAGMAGKKLRSDYFHRYSSMSR